MSTGGAMSEWYLISEKQPPTDQLVVMAARNKYAPSGWNVYPSDHPQSANIDATHWCYLPEFPSRIEQESA